MSESTSPGRRRKRTANREDVIVTQQAIPSLTLKRRSSATLFRAWTSEAALTGQGWNESLDRLVQLYGGGEA